MWSNSIRQNDWQWTQWQNNVNTLLFPTVGCLMSGWASGVSPVFTWKFVGVHSDKWDLTMGSERILVHIRGLAHHGISMPGIPVFAFIRKNFTTGTSMRFLLAFAATIMIKCWGFNLSSNINSSCSRTDCWNSRSWPFQTRTSSRKIAVCCSWPFQTASITWSCFWFCRFGTLMLMLGFSKLTVTATATYQHWLVIFRRLLVTIDIGSWILIITFYSILLDWNLVLRSYLQKWGRSNQTKTKYHTD